MRTRSKYIFAGIILLALLIVGLSLLLNQGKNPGGNGLTVEKPQEVKIVILSAIAGNSKYFSVKPVARLTTYIRREYFSVI